MSNSNRHTTGDDDDSQRSVASSVASSTVSGAGSRTMYGDVARGMREPPKPIYVMRPGTFEIVLCVDNCEIAGGYVDGNQIYILP